MAVPFRTGPVIIKMQGRVDRASDEEAGAQQDDERDQKELLSFHSNPTVDPYGQTVKGVNDA